MCKLLSLRYAHVMDETDILKFSLSERGEIARESQKTEMGDKWPNSSSLYPKRAQ